MKKSLKSSERKSTVEILGGIEISYEIRIFITRGGERGAFGPGVGALLKGIKELGSLSKAAEDMGMAYSKAWNIMRHIEKYLGFTLISRHTGRGYGSTLTENGEKLLNRYELFLADLSRYTAFRFKETFEGFSKKEEQIDELPK